MTPTHGSLRAVAWGLESGTAPAVARMGSGSVSWQLAVRRLQLSSGTAARMVNGIAVAVAGAIALQMLFAGVEDSYTKSTGKDPARAQLEVFLQDGVPLAAAGKEVAQAKGVKTAVALATGAFAGERKDPESFTELTVGDCTALRELATISSCRDGDVFVVDDPNDPDVRKYTTPGRTLWFDPSYSGEGKGAEIPWALPTEVKKVPERSDSLRTAMSGLMATPSAVPAKAMTEEFSSSVFVRLDPSVPDVKELAWNAVARVDPLVRVSEWTSVRRVDRYTNIRTGLFVGAACVLVLIGAGLLVSQLEQLRERRKLWSALVAFGTRRRTLSLSVLWQTAIPIALGLTLACAVGLTLGVVLLKMSSVPVTVDWASVLSMAGIGAGVVLLVTALSLPPLLRLMRPEGLRTE